VKRQWCGNTGKLDNCVVSVHTGYVVGDFQCLLDGDVYLPEEWATTGLASSGAYSGEVVFAPSRRLPWIRSRAAWATGFACGLDVRRILRAGRRIA